MLAMNNYDDDDDENDDDDDDDHNDYDHDHDCKNVFFVTIVMSFSLC